VNDQQACATRRREHLPAWRDRRLKPLNVISKRGAKAAGLQKIPLHVNDDERRFVEIDGYR
jgi:hypothetical protein